MSDGTGAGFGRDWIAGLDVVLFPLRDGFEAAGERPAKNGDGAVVTVRAADGSAFRVWVRPTPAGQRVAAVGRGRVRPPRTENGVPALGTWPRFDADAATLHPLLLEQHRLAGGGSGGQLVAATSAYGQQMRTAVARARGANPAVAAGIAAGVQPGEEL